MPKIGYKQTLEHRAVNRGRKLSPETRARIGAAQLGRPVSAETREKIAAAHRGMKHTPEARTKMMGNQNCLGHQNYWRGGRTIDGAGYVRLLRRDHPSADCNGYVREHRLVMEEHLGRTLLPTEVVHHGPGGPSDNSLKNLTLFETDADHQRWHRQQAEARI